METKPVGSKAPAIFAAQGLTVLTSVATVQLTSQEGLWILAALYIGIAVSMCGWIAINLDNKPPKDAITTKQWLFTMFVALTALITGIMALATVYGNYPNVMFWYALSILFLLPAALSTLHKA